MTDKVEELIKDIAVKHGIAIGRDDPILVLQTINELLLQDTANTQKIILESFKEEMQKISITWGNDAKEKAEAILNTALTASKQAMSKLMQESCNDSLVALQKENSKFLTEIRRMVQQAKRIDLFIISCLATIGAVFLIFLHL